MKRKDYLIALAICLIIALFISPFASPWPDGLEKVAEDLGFLAKGEGQPVFKALLSDYSPLTGALGTLLVMGLGTGLAFILRPRKKKS